MKFKQGTRKKLLLTLSSGKGGRFSGKPEEDTSMGNWENIPPGAVAGVLLCVTLAVWIVVDTIRKRPPPPSGV
jgi:hypothetical protein